MRINAEENVVPDPKRVITKLFNTHTIVDQRLGVWKLQPGGEVARGDTERIRQDCHSYSPFFLCNEETIGIEHPQRR